MNAYNNLPDGFQLCGRYYVREPIGAGHSSVVYRALDLNTQTETAVKVLDPFLAQDPAHVERFKREVAIIGRLKHPNIIKIYDILETDGFHVICMELAPGLDGKAWLEKNGIPSIDLFLKIVRQILDALSVCHENGVIHRDLKPQNIILDDKSHVKLLDFGISKMNTMSDLTKTGTCIGTPEYMAPELFRSARHSDPRCDIWSLGVLMYEFLTGRPLFSANSLGTLFKLHSMRETEAVGTYRSDVPKWLESVIGKCLAHDPNSRYQSVYEIFSDMEKKNSARAHITKGSQSAICLNCKSEILTGLTFCHQCGTFTYEGFEKGAYSLILEDFAEEKELAEYIARAYNRPVTLVRKKIASLPVLLTRKVSKQTAERIAGDISLFPCRLVITKDLLGRHKLPSYFAWATIFSAIFLSIIVIGKELFMAVPFVLISAIALAALLYALTVKPLLKLKKKTQNDTFEKNARLILYADRLKKIADGKIRSVLGHILVKYFRIKEKIAEKSELAPDETLLDETAEAAFKLMEIVGPLGEYLKSTSLSEIREKCDTLSVRIENSRDVEQIDQWIAAKSQLESEIARYREIENRYADIFTRVIQLNGQLKQFEDSIGKKTKPDLLQHVLKSLTG